jgi:hypothetical protein
MELGTERFHKHRKGVNKERAKASHYAKTGCQHYAPAVITEIKFGLTGLRFGALRSECNSTAVMLALRSSQ